MGLVHPEIKMARKVLQKHSLSIPFDLNNLVSQYANIVYKRIPINGVDGICLNLKMPGKRPTVVVNETSARTRQKFTLAHELGHIIIPWHLGTIIDDISVSENIDRSSNIHYWNLEREANRFASELLMPFEWILSIFQENPDPEYLVSQACEHCGVSEIAAKIRVENALDEISLYLMPPELIKELYEESGSLEQVQRELVEKTPFHPLIVARHMMRFLQGKIAFCVEEDNMVIGCGGTTRTNFYYQREGSKFLDSPYPYFQSYYFFNYYDINTHWWTLDVSFDITDDPRSWQEILNKIAIDLADPEGLDKFKRKINGRFSGFSGQFKRKNPGSDVNDFIDEVMHRFNDVGFIDLLNHPDFLIFVRKRSEALFPNLIKRFI